VLIERLQREIAVCAAAEIEEFLNRDPGRWHVVSIREPFHPEAVLTDAKRAHAVVFKDVLIPEDAQGQGPRASHLEGILRFVERGGREPIVLQCWAGRSRSAAAALVIIVKELWDQGLDGAELVRTAVDILLAIRPIAMPNQLVLRLGLEQFLPHPLGSTRSTALIQEPRIQNNRIGP
jgi:predicted protein tyrosine phosphatase